MTESMVYWATRLDHIHELFALVAGLALIVLIISLLFLFTGPNMFYDWEERLKTRVKRVVFLAASTIFIAMLFATFLPSTKEYIVIKAIPAIVNNEDVQKIGTDAVKVVRDYFTERANL